MLDRKMLSNVVIAIAGSTLCAGALADTKPGQPATQGHESASEQSATFDTLDMNRNGFISETEAQVSPALAMKRQELDDNGDGQLDRTEFAAFEGESAMDDPAPSMDSEDETMSGAESAEHTDPTSDSDY